MDKPTYVIEDPELVKQICVKEFDSFVNHIEITNSGDDPLFTKALVALRDNEWREMRSSLSPVFTGNKIRIMYDLVRECAETFVSYCKNGIQINDGGFEIDAKDLCEKSSVDVISACAFGVKVDSLNDPNNPVFVNTKQSLDLGPFVEKVKANIFVYFPKLASFLGIKAIPDETTKFFTDLITSTIKMRRKKKSSYKDVIELMSQTLQTGPWTQWSDIDIAAQCFDFIAAGLETTAITLTFALYELALHSDIQAKLHLEIDSLTDSTTITYEKLQELLYLDAFISETLRKHPPGYLHDRVCNKPVVVTDDSGKEILIEKDVQIWISVYAMHHNEKYFPNPEKFDPERFLSSTKIEPYSYLPFGKGPRACIGMRFALMEVKLILFHLLSHFRIETCERTPSSVRYIGEFTLTPDKDIIVKLKPRT